MSDEQNAVTGGWSEFDKVADNVGKILGEVKPGAVHLSPLLVSRQVVNGINYLFVANDGVQAIQGNQPFPVVVKVYVAPGAAPAVTQLHEIGHSGSMGSYGPFQKTDGNEEAQAALKEAFSDRLGIEFTALAVSSQLVAGHNYLFAGNVKPLTKDPHTYPAFVTVYKPLQDKARITSIKRAWEI
ncbi:hypothetical protein ACYULU_15650 [Breznakiellaceae bacterium SP9]